MTGTWTFETAVEFWTRHRGSDTDSVWEDFEAAEAFILDHTPRSASDAAQIIGVLLDQGCGGRCDGRDSKALRRLRSYVVGLQQAGSIAA